VKVRSEPVHSFFDTTLGSVAFNVPAGSIPEVTERLAEARDRRRDSSDQRSDYANMLMGWVTFRHYPLVAHEWGHALQALTHPALYLRCLREWSAVCAVVDEISKTPFAIPLPLMFGETWLGDLTWPTFPVRISFSEEGVPRTEDSTERPRPNDISETDLLEDSASIFQYRAEIGAEGTAEGYRRWLQEGRKYLYAKVFDFVAAMLSPADAYVAVPCLVMAAYSTNWPVHVFAQLLAVTAKEPAVIPSELGSDLYWAYLERLLQTSLKGGEVPEPRRTLMEEADPRRIDRNGVLSLADRFPMHPLSAIVRLAWREEGEIRRLREAMLHPYRAFSRRRRQAETWLEPFRPPVTSFRILGSGFGISDTLMYVSPTLVDHGERPQELSWEQFLFELMRIKAFVFASATPFFDALPHNCPHQSCRFHDLGMCRAWNHIPGRPEDCSFPPWLRHTAKRRFDFDREMLVPVDR
jgi:hypothetical protein